MSPPSLDDLPSFAFTVVSFLQGEDVLSLRSVSKRVKDALIDDEAEAIWAAFLRADFEGYDGRQGLRVRASHFGPSVFGTTGQNAVEELKSAFETWKSWKRASWRYSHRNVGDWPQPDLFHLKPKYFLRAAEIWARLEQWLLLQDRFGSNVRSSLNQGFSLQDLSWPDEFKQNPILHPTLALLSFYGGQRQQSVPGTGLFGGFAAYDFLTNSRFVGGAWFDDAVVVGSCPLARQFGTHKFIMVEPSTGKVLLWGPEKQLACPSLKEDAVLVWMEEYVGRLESGFFQLGSLWDGETVHGPMTSILHYPQQTPPGRSNAACTRRVTNGVEIVASSVYSPITATNGFSFVYSIRMRVLEPGDAEYDAGARSFSTSCQLKSRHLRLFDENTGRTDQVDGDGVIGSYPLLREGSYRDDSGHSSSQVREGEEVSNGIFVYQSCTNHNATSFGGHMLFVPGSLAEPTGPAFQVEIEPFPLDSSPDFIY